MIGKVGQLTQFFSDDEIFLGGLGNTIHTFLFSKFPFIVNMYNDQFVCCQYQEKVDPICYKLISANLQFSISNSEAP